MKREKKVFAKIKNNCVFLKTRQKAKGSWAKTPEVWSAVHYHPGTI